MPRRSPSSQNPKHSLSMDDAYRIIEVLGPMPEEVLAAMVDYGLSDSEIGRYFGLSREVVTTLRTHWRIRGTP
ncbi:hypothetical protein [Roseovarius sp. D22-M7]|uniref:hypothetical protein n=1 Tax=Roseovarius sp. D22-M7 TaxID=3127116 RepID=UPI003010104B